jgi:hypothetical protein
MTSTEKKKNFERPLFQTESFISLILSEFITLTVLAFLTFACNYGYDLTDESFYVLLIQHYQAYKYTLSQFGFIYQPIAGLLNYNIFHLRIFNILTTYFLSVGTIGLFYFYINKNNSSSARQKLIDLTAIAGISTSSLLYFATYNWLPTPSYNSLNFQGIHLVVSGLLMALYPSRLYRAFGSVVMSFGGWLVFMAKPTSAILLGIVCFVVLLLNKRICRKLIVTIVLNLGALFILTIYLLDAKFEDFIKRYQISLEGLKLVGFPPDGTSIWRIDFPLLSTKEWVCFSVISMLIASLVYYLRAGQWRSVVASFIFILAFAFYGAVYYRQLLSSDFNLPRYAQLQILSVPIGVVLSISAYSIYFGSVPKIRKPAWWAAVFLILPYIYAFGTGTNYFRASSAAAFFWILAAIAILSAMDLNWMKNSLLPLAFISQLVTVIFLLKAVGSPYRQPNNLFKETRSVEINNSKSKIRVNVKIAEYFAEIRKIATNGHFKSDDSIIDLTGCSPGIAVILGTFNLGLPWVSGGYPGSNQNALFYLMKLPGNQIRKAWVITEPLGKRALNEEILSKLGLNLVNDYEMVGKVTAPACYRGSRNESLQVIYKPK